MEDLAKVAANAARRALVDWSPDSSDGIDRLANAIGQAVAAAIERHEESSARHTALAMAGLDDDDETALLNWQV
jgi:glucokinase